MKLLLKYGQLVFFISLFTTVDVMTGQSNNDLNEGKKIYEDKCAQCHGLDGKGESPASEYLNPRPRDFTRGKYKIRSTESRELPTDEDLFIIITNGMPGTSMPGWDNLSESDRRKLVSYIKTFSKRFALTDQPPKMINIKDRVPFSDESAAEGRKVYEEIECFKCHGQDGRGDGESALDLVDEWNYPIRPTDLTEKWNFRGGSSVEEIFKRFIGGIDGTPMPSILSSFVMDEEIDDIQIKIEDEEPLTEEEREKFEKATEEVRRKSWHLANYVWSLAPDGIPEVDYVLKSQLIEDDLPKNIDDPRWDGIKSNMFPLVGQVIVEERNFTPSIDAVFVKTVYNDSEISFLLAWDDPSFSEEKSVDSSYNDRFTVQFPTKLSDRLERPYFLMGDSRKSVYIWQWETSNSLSPESGSDKVLSLVEGNANGITTFAEQPFENQGVLAKSDYSHGRYRLLINRSLTTEDKSDLQFETGRFIPIAFFAWDGSSGETGTKCSVSTWYYLLLEEPSPSIRYLYTPVAAILTIAFEVFMMVRIRRRGDRVII